MYTQIFLILVVLAISASAFRTPAQTGRVAARAFNTKTNMVPIDTVVESSSTFLSQFSQLMASEMDFGGYAGPAGSLLFIAAIIVTLAPPLESPDSTTPY